VVPVLIIAELVYCGGMTDHLSDLLRPDSRPMLLLAEKRAAIASSCVGYDAGKVWEARRIANEIAMLVHDPLRGRGVSLLTQMGVKKGMSFVSSIEYDPTRGDEHFIGLSPMTMMALSSGSARIVALCQAGAPPKSFIGHVAFSNWWEQGVSTRSKTGGLSRKNIILSIRDQDGGAHVDPELTDEEYLKLTTDPVAAIRIGGKPAKGLHLAIARQIGWEIEQTFTAAFGVLTTPTP